MKNLLILILSIFSISFSNAQILDSKKVIDSMSAEKWQKLIPDVDSITEASLTKVPTPKKDTVILTPSLDKIIWFLINLASAIGILGEIIT